VLSEVRCKFGPNDLGPDGEISVSQAGGGVESSCPPNMAYLVKKVTLGGGRPNRGRFYLPGVGEARVDDSGVVDGTFLSLLQGHIDDWHDLIVSSIGTSVVLHAEGSPVTTPTPIESYVLDAKVATQRRRLRR